MATILIYSEKEALLRELMTAAAVISAPLGMDVRAVTIDNPEVLADTAAVAAVLEAAAADIVLLASNRRGRELAGRLAQNMGAGCLTDVNALSVEGQEIACTRNALGGATVASQSVTTAKQVIAISPRSYAPAEGGSIETLAGGSPAVTLLGVQAKGGDSVDIEAAKILVAVGQGLEDQGDLPAVEAIARALGGEIACSKPVATDRKWLDEERIIGLSGKKCKPELAILMGISGQVQFTVGIRDAKTIVSINSDENAFMNQMSDYYLVADIKDVLGDLQKALG
ncbi:MAG: electron transfer flavoprotein subunit alpha/FixB family protein [Syntrophomonadaceae bacterium]|nr:electron transfer flavoprotein subunit alpha/FixB family protein [Syntrophomonadaceae bacterium]